MTIKIPKIHRFLDNADGTFGRIKVGDFSCYTIEREWRGNNPNISCIPCGEYQLKRGMYNKYGYPAYQIMGVPNRTYIKMHKARWMRHLQGCIGFGYSIRADIDDKDGVLKMRMDEPIEAFEDFMAAMDGIRSTSIIITQDW